MKTGASLPGLDEARQRVLHFQRKLHDWASEDAERGFRDLWNLVSTVGSLRSRHPSRICFPGSFSSTAQSSPDCAVSIDTCRTLHPASSGRNE